MTRIIRVLALVPLLVVLGFGAVPEAAAQMNLDQAKAAGLIGERPDGLVGLVDAGAGADLRRLVDDVNRQRLARYGEIAASNASTIEAVQAVAGAELIERTPTGQYVMDAGGRWFVK